MLKKFQWDAIKRMGMAGLSRRKIARCLGIDRRTVASALRKTHFPLRHVSGPINAVEPHREIVEQLLLQCHGISAMGIWRELSSRGISVGYNSVKRFLRRLRKGAPMRQSAISALPVIRAPEVVAVEPEFVELEMIAIPKTPGKAVVENLRRCWSHPNPSRSRSAPQCSSCLEASTNWNSKGH